MVQLLAPGTKVTNLTNAANGAPRAQYSFAGWFTSDSGEPNVEVTGLKMNVECHYAYVGGGAYAGYVVVDGASITSWRLIGEDCPDDATPLGDSGDCESSEPPPYEQSGGGGAPPWQEGCTWWAYLTWQYWPSSDTWDLVDVYYQCE